MVFLTLESYYTSFPRSFRKEISSLFSPYVWGYFNDFSIFKDVATFRWPLIYKNQVFESAAHGGHLSIMRMMHNLNMDGLRYDYALYYASSNGHLNVVQFVSRCVLMFCDVPNFEECIRISYLLQHFHVCYYLLSHFKIDCSHRHICDIKDSLVNSMLFQNILSIMDA